MTQGSPEQTRSVAWRMIEAGGIELAARRGGCRRKQTPERSWRLLGGALGFPWAAAQLGSGFRSGVGSRLGVAPLGCVALCNLVIVESTEECTGPIRTAPRGAEQYLGVC